MRWMGRFGLFGGNIHMAISFSPRCGCDCLAIQRSMCMMHLCIMLDYLLLSETVCCQVIPRDTAERGGYVSDMLSCIVTGWPTPQNLWICIVTR